VCALFAENKVRFAHAEQLCDKYVVIQCLPYKLAHSTVVTGHVHLMHAVF